MKRLVVSISLLAVLTSSIAAPAQQRVRFHGYLEWIAG
jgi:hypothetical protein